MATKAKTLTHLNAREFEEEFGMTYEQAKDLVSINLQTSYSQAAASFGERPNGGDNWTRLVTAMHALQYWRSSLDEPTRISATAHLFEMGIGTWTRELRDMQARAFGSAK